jgi:hypothetical protein
MRNCILIGLVTLALFGVALTQDWGEGSFDFPGRLNPFEFSDSDKSDTLGACWMSTYGRASQKPTTSCAKGQTELRSNCYDPCPKGYTPNTASDTSDLRNDDPNLSTDSSDIESFCWQDCPKGLDKVVDTSNCAKVVSDGIWSTWTNKTQCDEANHRGCAECAGPGQWSGISECGACAWYCPVTCPSDMNQSGFFCERNHFNRTGVPLGCGEGLVISLTLCAMNLNRRISPVLETFAWEHAQMAGRCAELCASMVLTVDIVTLKIHSTLLVPLFILSLRLCH